MAFSIHLSQILNPSFIYDGLFTFNLSKNGVVYVYIFLICPQMHLPFFHLVTNVYQDLFLTFYFNTTNFSNWFLLWNIMIYSCIVHFVSLIDFFPVHVQTILEMKEKIYSREGQRYFKNQYYESKKNKIVKADIS